MLFCPQAARLRITQSALSRQITELEKQHGFQLFNRDRKRAALPAEAGRTFEPIAGLRSVKNNRSDPPRFLTELGFVPPRRKPAGRCVQMGIEFKEESWVDG
jgi:hypothetical protein